MAYYTYLKKFYSRERRLRFSSKKRIRAYLTRTGLKVALFSCDSYNYLNFKGYLYKKFAKVLLNTHGVKTISRIIHTQTVKNKAQKSLVTSNKKNSLYCLLQEDSSKIIFAALIKTLLVGDTHASATRFIYVQKFIAMRRFVAAALNKLSKLKIRFFLKAYRFGMRKQRRHYLRAGTKIKKNKKARSKLRQLRIHNKRRYKQLVNLDYLRGGWTMRKTVRTGNLSDCTITAFKRFVNQPKNMAKSTYNVNILVRDIFKNECSAYSNTRACLKSVAFIDYRVYFIYLDLNYANPFLFFDLLCDSVLLNNAPTYSIKTIGVAFLTLNRFISLKEFTIKTKSRSYFKEGLSRALINTEFTVL